MDYKLELESVIGFSGASWGAPSPSASAAAMR